MWHKYDQSFLPVSEAFVDIVVVVVVEMLASVVVTSDLMDSFLSADIRKDYQYFSLKKSLSKF